MEIRVWHLLVLTVFTEGFAVIGAACEVSLAGGECVLAITDVDATAHSLDKADLVRAFGQGSTRLPTLPAGRRCTIIRHEPPGTCPGSPFLVKKRRYNQPIPYGDQPRKLDAVDAVVGPTRPAIGVRFRTLHRRDQTNSVPDHRCF